MSGLCGIPDVTTGRTDHDKGAAAAAAAKAAAIKSSSSVSSSVGGLRRGVGARTSSVSSSSFFRIKNSYRKSSRTTSTGSSSGASSGTSSSGSELDFDGEDLDEDDEEDSVIGVEDFGDMYINEDQSDLFDGAILKQILNKKAPVKITLKLQVTETTFSVWETVSWLKSSYKKSYKDFFQDWVVSISLLVQFKTHF